jgi:diguanylate cyclase (GGDEF)-like protein
MKEATFAPLALDLLNALDAQIAVLDAQGAIVAVNDAWRRFARENGAVDDTSPAGTSYLGVCEEACRAGADESARAMLDGLKLVLGGERDSFSLEYPCHSPDKRRWFVARVVRFTHAGATYLAAVHEDITARRLAQDALQETQASLEEVLARERVKARTDELTGLCNRRHFFELGGRLFAVGKRYGLPLALLMIDIDYFKRINDRFGHQAGDTVLRCIAQVAQRQSRSADVLARYGGEEFIALLPGTTATEGLAAAENLRARVAACREFEGVGPLQLTVSIGVAEVMPGDDTLESVIRRADEALYEAKKAGRDRSQLVIPP